MHKCTERVLVAKKEAFQKRIDYLDSKAKFFRSTILALISAIIWSVYAIIEGKVGQEIFVLSGAGLVVFILILIRIKSLEIKIEELINKLEEDI